MRQRDIEKESQGDRETGRQADRETERHRERLRRNTERIYIEADILEDMQ